MKLLDKLKNLKIRRWGPSEYTDAKKDGGGGTGLTGNLLDDWVNAITQGEYTKYEDVPIADKVGINEGWRREGNDYYIFYSGADFSNSYFYDTDTGNGYRIVKNAPFQYDTAQVK